MLVAYDKDSLIRDFYFPHVGQENHAGGGPFRVGVWVDGEFSWVPDGWDVHRDYLDDSLVTDVILTSARLGLKVTVNDLVDFHENIFLRRFTVENLTDNAREVRLFLASDFRIYGNDIGDTAAYRPEAGCLLHYKLDRYFLVGAYSNRKSGLDQFAAGNRSERLVGAWKDAEDGVLSGNPIAQGSVDSVAGIHLSIPPLSSEVCWSWTCAGRNWEEVLKLDRLVISRKPEEIFNRTLNYWKLWVNKKRLNFCLLPEEIAHLYRRSLMVMRTQIDNTGGIIAANDSDVVHFNRDTYSYMWPRDAALVSYGLDLAGYDEISRRFFSMCGDIISKEGYFLHKYTPSGAVASSWHPWFADGRRQLPIQEDETALVLWALWRHYDIYRDVEFIKPLYRPLIKNAADMMMNYRDRLTGLPLPSHDLWEERYGVFTYTASTVYAGLSAAANFAEAFGEVELAAEYRAGAAGMRDAMDTHLYMEDKGRFARSARLEDGLVVERDETVDASLFGIFAFGAYAPDDPKVVGTMAQVKERLTCRTAVGGLARYEGDDYYRSGGDVPGNPWFVCTLWLAQYYIALAGDREGLAAALDIMSWVARRALPSGVLAEQVNPYTDEPLSVSPLTWSHATFVICVQEYLNRLLEIDRCSACDQPKHKKYT